MSHDIRGTLATPLISAIIIIINCAISALPSDGKYRFTYRYDTVNSDENERRC